MKEEILKEIKEDYKRRKDHKMECLEIEDRIKELEENDLVKEYLELIGKSKKVNFDTKTPDEYLMYLSFGKYIYSIEETNNVFVYLGTFRTSLEYDIVHSSHDDRVDRNDPRAEYSKYQDLEKPDSINIPISKRDEFERSNKIIFPKGILNDRRYCELQDMFIKTCIESSQEEAVVKVLKQSKKS